MRFLFFNIYFLFFGFNYLNAQTIESALNEYAGKYEAEKAHVHYDKSAYTAGETIWFKAYLIQGIFPAETTKTFYLDWLDDKGNVLFHSVSPMYESSAVGQYDIPEDYKGQTIHVRGYTRWMLNFDTAFLYKKDIRILSAKSPTGTVIKPIASLQFFPEGGDAIEGIVNQIAFKATDQWGRPVKIKGIIESIEGKVVDSLITLHDGMGLVSFIPKPGIKYSAKWKDEKAEQHITLLPLIKSSGISLHTDINASRPYFSLTGSENMEDRLKEGFVLATMKERMVFKTSYSLIESNSVRKSIPITQLPSGILTITVFDKNSMPVAERILFINNEDYFFKTDIEVQHWGLNKRAKNEIKIEVPDNLVANISVSVTDEAIGSDSSENIFSTILLTSDLRGKIHNPAYYFTANTELVKSHLDLVMQTNGWRRFNWNELAKNRYPNINYPKDSLYLALSGTVNGVIPGTTNMESLIIMAKQKDSKTQMIFSSIDAQGRFRESAYVFYDTIIVYHQFPKTSLYKNASIKYMPDRLPAIFNNSKSNASRYYSNSTDTSGSGYNFKLAMDRFALLDFYKGKVLENVVIKSKIKPAIEVMDEKYSSGLFGGSDAYKFDMVNDPLSGAYQNIFTYLQGRVAGLQINQSGGLTELQWRGGTPQVYLDEMLTNVDMIATIPVNDVAFIKVFRPPFMGGSMGGDGGAIAIYTRRGDDFKAAPGKGLDRNTIMGYSIIRDFYSPNYQVFDQKNEQADYRTTLLWEPMILTKPGKSKKIIAFFNTDITKSFRIIIEGVSSDGQLTRFEQVID